MEPEWMEELAQHISVLKRTAAELGRLGEEKEFPALERNAKRILASVKMLELNVSDVLADRSCP